MRISRSVAAMVVIGLFAAPVEAAGIDCAKPASASDHMICRDKSLLARDAIVRDLYAAALKHDEADKIRERQRRWIATVQSCGDAACIRQAYDDQIGFLLTTKGGRSTSADFQSNTSDGNEGHLAIFGPVDGLVAVSLASTYVGPGGAEAGDVNADGVDGVVPLTREHAQLSRDACKISLDRLNAKTWRVSQAGVCDFANGVTLQGTYLKQ
ncbi:lysozyme inhibitor LprI family protein [Rhizobium sp. NPDC090279]|uniref:lysozyme inhibitor LprI family protein n=1 Tax=Rhizobium sp. NPDC090279 TaxID=3364499 RepID=UPI003839D284